MNENEVIFYEIESVPNTAITLDFVAEGETSAEVVESPVEAEPFFIGMRVGGVCIVISLGVAVIISIFKKLSQT